MSAGTIGHECRTCVREATRLVGATPTCETPACVRAAVKANEPRDPCGKFTPRRVGGR